MPKGDLQAAPGPKVTAAEVMHKVVPGEVAVSKHVAVGRRVQVAAAHVGKFLAVHCCRVACVIHPPSNRCTIAWLCTTGCA